MKKLMLALLYSVLPKYIA